MSLPKSPAAKASYHMKPANSVSRPRTVAKKMSKKSAGATVPSHAKASTGTVKKTRQTGERKNAAVAAVELAQELEKGLADGRLDILTPQALQALMASLCKFYAASIEADRVFPLLADRSSITGTEVMIACGALLKSANLQVFELGMWQSWTGR